MTHFAGLDVALRMTQVCIVDATGTPLLEQKIDTNPETLAHALKRHGWVYTRVGLEAGPMSQWLYEGLTHAGLPVIAIETKAAQGFLKSQRTNKTDRNDARGIAQLMQIGPRFYKAVHIKTMESQQDRALLSGRSLMQRQMIACELSVRGILRNFGVKLGAVTHRRFAERVAAKTLDHPEIFQIVQPMLEAHERLLEQFGVYQRQLALRAKQDPTCRLLMTMPGIGPFVSLTFKAAIDVPERFHRSRSVAASIGLTPLQYQSGETDISGRISRAGDAELRSAMVEAAHICMTVARDNALQRWARDVEKRKGRGKAVVALARRMTVILHRMWMENTVYLDLKVERKHQLPLLGGGKMSTGTDGMA